MLRVHEAVKVVKQAYPDQVPNEGEGLRRDCFYYGLTPSLRDALSFTMADLPEREPTDTSFDTSLPSGQKARGATSAMRCDECWILNP